MKNMMRHQIKAIPIQVPSTRSMGCFHQTRSGGGKIALMAGSLRLGYLRTGMFAISITPQTM
jgi:hypothetical protein